MEMQIFKKVHLLQLIFIVKMILFPSSLSQEITIPSSYNCGGIRIQPPFSHQNFSQYSSLLRHMILCKSNKLYFRTTIALFRVSSIDYANKQLVVSHSSPCSSTSDFLSPRHLSAGFPPPSSPNSLLLLNCSNQRSRLSLFPCNSSELSNGLCSSSSTKHRNDQELTKGFATFSCFLIDDVAKIEKDFHPMEMNCTHYSRVYKSSNEKFELGMRISFDIPDHVPNPCDECEKPDGNCGAGLRCVCHPKKCKDKVVSVGSRLKPYGNLVFNYLVFVIVTMGLLCGY